MRQLCIATATSAVLLTAGVFPDHAAAQGVTLPPPGYGPLPYAYGPPRAMAYTPNARSHHPAPEAHGVPKMTAAESASPVKKRARVVVKVAS